MERQNCELHLLPLLNIGATTTSTSSGPGFLFGRLFHYWQFKFSSSDVLIWLPSPGCFQMTLNLIELWLVIYLTLSLEIYCTPCYQNCLLYFFKKKKFMSFVFHSNDSEICKPQFVLICLWFKFESRNHYNHFPNHHHVLFPLSFLYIIVVWVCPHDQELQLPCFQFPVCVVFEG